VTVSQTQGSLLGKTDEQAAANPFPGVKGPQGRRAVNFDRVSKAENCGLEGGYWLSNSSFDLGTSNN